MTRRHKALSVAALCVIATGGAAAWTLAPSQVHAADTPKAEQPMREDPWAKGPVDRGNMVQGVLDYRSDHSRR